MREGFYVYILANNARTLYTGVTNDLARRMQEHRLKKVVGFAAHYGIDALVYYEVHETALAAIEREKRIKRWTRAKKVALIESMNPQWDELSATLHDNPDEFNLVQADADE